MKIAILTLLLLSLAPTAHAKRVTYLAPLTSNNLAGTYDTASPSKYYCETGFLFAEQLYGRAANRDLRMSGVVSELNVALRNLSSVDQTVNLVVESVKYEACSTTTSTLPTSNTNCLNKFLDNSGSGYTIEIPVPAKKSQTTRIQFGCQGDTTSNNCYIWVYPLIREETTVMSERTIAGVAALTNTGQGSQPKFICYQLKTSVNARIEVTSDKGSLTGSVDMVFAGPLTNGVTTLNLGTTSYKINGGRPF